MKKTCAVTGVKTPANIMMAKAISGDRKSLFIDVPMVNKSGLPIGVR